MYLSSPPFWITPIQEFINTEWRLPHLYSSYPLIPFGPSYRYYKRTLLCSVSGGNLNRHTLKYNSYIGFTNFMCTWEGGVLGLRSSGSCKMVSRATVYPLEHKQTHQILWYYEYLLQKSLKREKKRWNESFIPSFHFGLVTITDRRFSETLANNWEKAIDFKVLYGPICFIFSFRSTKREFNYSHVRHPLWFQPFSNSSSENRCTAHARALHRMHDSSSGERVKTVWSASANSSEVTAWKPNN